MLLKTIAVSILSGIVLGAWWAMSYGATWPCQTTIPNNSLKIGTEIAPIKAFKWLYLRGVYSTLLSSMSFAKRYNEKGLKEKQAVNVKMMSAPATAFKILKYWSPRFWRVLTKNCTRLFSCLIPKLGIRFVAIWSKVTGLKPKAQTKTVGTVLPQVYISDTTQASKGTHGSVRCYRQSFYLTKWRQRNWFDPTCYFLFTDGSCPFLFYK